MKKLEERIISQHFVELVPVPVLCGPSSTLTLNGLLWRTRNVWMGTTTGGGGFTLGVAQPYFVLTSKIPPIGFNVKF